MSEARSVFDYIRSVSDAFASDFLIERKTEIVTIRVDRCSKHGNTRYIHAREFFGDDSREIMVIDTRQSGEALEPGYYYHVQAINNERSTFSGRPRFSLEMVVEADPDHLDPYHGQYVEFYEDEILPHFNRVLSLDDEEVVFYGVGTPYETVMDNGHNGYAVRCYFRDALPSELPD